MSDLTEADAGALASAARLRAALEQLAGALARLHLNDMLDAESALEAAMANLPTAGVSEGARGAIRMELERARGALTRSRRLGAALGDLTAIGFEAQGLARGYGRGEERFGPGLEGRQLDTTV